MLELFLIRDAQLVGHWALPRSFGLLRDSRRCTRRRADGLHPNLSNIAAIDQHEARAHRLHEAAVVRDQDAGGVLS